MCSCSSNTLHHGQQCNVVWQVGMLQRLLNAKTAALQEAQGRLDDLLAT